MKLVGKTDLLSQFTNIDEGDNEEEGGEEGKEYEPDRGPDRGNDSSNLATRMAQGLQERFSMAQVNYFPRYENGAMFNDYSTPCLQAMAFPTLPLTTMAEATCGRWPSV
jgi:hypothetical protein